MSDVDRAQDETPPRRWVRWRKPLTWLGGAVLVVLVLATEVNVNPPLETYLAPIVNDDDISVAMEEKDYPTIYRYLAQKASGGDPDAMTQLASYSSVGWGLSFPDHCRAFDWWFEAAKLGNAKAHLELGKILLYGGGGYHDPMLGYIFAKRAEEEGFKPATAFIQKIIPFYFSEDEVAVLDQSVDQINFDIEGFPEKRVNFIIPFLSTFLNFFIRQRSCDDPKIIEILLPGHGKTFELPGGRMRILADELERRYLWNEQR